MPTIRRWFEFDGMQGDTVARGQTFGKPLVHFLPQGALNLKVIWRENLPKHEFATQFEVLYTSACMFIKADKQQRIQAKM